MLSIKNKKRLSYLVRLKILIIIHALGKLFTYTQGKIKTSNIL